MLDTLTEISTLPVVVWIYTSKYGTTFRIVKKEGRLWYEKQMTDLMGQKYFGCSGEIDTHFGESSLVELVNQLGNLLTNK